MNHNIQSMVTLCTNSYTDSTAAYTVVDKSSRHRYTLTNILTTHEHRGGATNFIAGGINLEKSTPNSYKLGVKKCRNVDAVCVLSLIHI